MPRSVVPDVQTDRIALTFPRAFPTMQIMDISRLALAGAVSLFVQSSSMVSTAQTQTYETNVWVETIAGSGFTGYLDGQGLQTMFDGPSIVAVDGAKNLFVWDSGNSRIRRITQDWKVTTFAEIPRANPPLSMIFDKDNNLYLGAPHKIVKIGPQGVATVFAGKDPGGYLDGFRTDALFAGTGMALAINAQGEIFVGDVLNARIRKIDTNGMVTTIAGSGNIGSRDGNGIFSSFKYPTSLTVDPAGNIFVGDSGYYVIRKITPNGDVTTFAGIAGSFGYSEGVDTNALLRIVNLSADRLGNIYVSDQNLVRKITPEGRTTVLAGSYLVGGYADGSGRDARFGGVSAVALDSDGTMYVTDEPNNRIRKISYSPVPSTGLRIQSYAGLSITGTIGRSYRVEFANSLSDTTQWFTAVTVELNNSPYLWIDADSINHQKRFYRAVLLP